MFLFRLFSFIILVSLFLASIVLKSNLGLTIFFICGVFLSYGAVYEFNYILSKINKQSYVFFTPLVGAIIFISTLLFRSIQVNFFIFALFLTVCWVSLLFSGNNKYYLEKVVNSVAGLMLISIPLMFLAFIYVMGEGKDYEGRMFLLFLVFVTKAGDTGAYIVGTLSNKITKGSNHRLVPSISPKKSWEGLIGGLVSSVLISIFLSGILLKDSSSVCIALFAGILLFFGGFLGDLIESSFKRTCGVKDSGGIIPGIGGVLDLLDSFLVNAPIFYYFLLYFNFNG